jgi:RNA polymerase sigma factor (sigma-70 family)
MSALLQASDGAFESESVSDHTLVAAVRRGDDRAFEALYQRYQRRIQAYVFGMVKDHQRAEDVTQEVFVSALRRMRATERPIAFKPWIYEIAKNACIDQFRRSKRAEEISFDADEGLAPSDYGRLVSKEPVPDAAVAAKQQLDHMVGAFGGLSEAHHQILVLRELEGLSYREIGERMGMSRPAVESTLFRARRRLSEEYDELASGQRCLRVQSIISSAAGGRIGARDTRRLARHVAHCQPCRRQALAAGVDQALVARRPLRERAIEKVAALFPFPLLLRGRRSGAGESWSSQLPAVSDHAAAGGAKLVAVAAVLVAGLGAGVGTQIAKPEQRAADGPAQAGQRTAERTGSGAAAPLSATVAGNRSATDRASTGSSREPRRTGKAERSGTGRSERRQGTAPASQGAGGGSAPAANVPAAVQHSAPSLPAVETPSTPTAQAPATPKVEIKLPATTLPGVSVEATPPSLPVDSVTDTVQGVTGTVDQTTDTVTQPIQDATGIKLP